MEESPISPSIDKLIQYLANASYAICSTPTYHCTLDYRNHDDDEIDRISVQWEGPCLPWKPPTCLALLHYVIKFDSTFKHDELMSDTITCLNDSAAKCMVAMIEVERRYRSPELPVFQRSVQELHKEIGEMFVNSFMPQVQKFFSVPKRCDKDKPPLKLNEVLAGFLNFLVQILNAEANFNCGGYTNYSLVLKELTYLLTFLGDTPFSFSDELQCNTILELYETLANEAGDLIYSFVFSPRLVAVRRFNVAKDTLLIKVELVNAMIKEYLELHPSFGVPKENTVDSLYIVDSFLEDLKQLMSRDVIIDKVVKHQIISLHEELKLSQSLLKDIKVTSHMCEANETRSEIRVAAYEAEYLVNSFVVGNLPVWYLNLRLQSVVEKIKIIGTSLGEIYSSDKVFLQVEKKYIIAQLAERSVPTDMVDKMVGFEDKKGKILSYLVEGSKAREIISVHGMAGLGKTTMARKLYDDRSVHHRFDRRAWCVVSQTYQKRKVLIDILTSLSSEPVKNLASDMKDGDLGLKIHKSFKGRRYLIVIDDVWDKKTWDDLGIYLPDDRNGSRILITSRIKDTAPTGSILYPLPTLSEAGCWVLLQHKVFGKGLGLCPPELRRVGKSIAAKCQGVPLAVVVIAGTLANIAKEHAVWKQVERNINSYVFEDSNGLLKLLELSYEHLPDHLRPCFLYFASFPEDAEISVKKLIRLWIAEGFVHKESDKRPEDVAESYLFDLINRSLVLIARTRSSNDGVKTCNIHDLWYDLCTKKAQEENFLTPLKENSSVYQRHHRVCSHDQSSSTYWTAFGLHFRSFSGYLPDPSSRFPHMALLRVMILFKSPWSHFKLIGIELLVHLRYLCIDEMPPETISRLVNLEVLCVLTYTYPYLPLSILKMVNLRHLWFEITPLVPEGLDSLQPNNLESISFIAMECEEDEGILRCSPNIAKLKCRCNNETFFPCMSSLTKIESLNMVFRNPFNGELARINFPSTLKKLHLSGIGLPWESMSKIGKLPNLHALKIEKDAFIGEEWETKDDEFQELRYLRISLGLKKWITSSEHFPELECLVIVSCWELQELPNELGDITTLQRIEVHNCSRRTRLSAVHIKEEQQKAGNEELMVINR